MNKNQHIPQGYKLSPLGIIPEDWEVKRLGDYVTIISGESPSLYVLKPEGKYPYVKVEDMNACEKYQAISREYSDDNRNVIPKGSIIFPKRGAAILNNKVRIAQINILMDSNMMAITPMVDSLNYEFLYYTIINEKLYKIADTSTIPQINNKHIIPYQFRLPSIEEQQRIVSVLQLWDTAISKQTQLVEKLTLRKRGLMQQLLTGKKRLKGFEGEWKEVKLGEIGTRITRKNSEDNKNVVTISAQRGFVIQTDFFSKSIASEVLDNYYLVHRNEFCYNKSYSNGYPMGAIKRLKTFDKAVVTTLYICFKLKDKPETDIDFFEQYCESGLLNKELIKVANEGGRAHGLLNVTPDDFFNMRMRIPNHKEQNAIASVLIQADKGIELANKKLSQFQAQKRGLMQVLLTGKKRIK